MDELSKILVKYDQLDAEIFETWCSMNDAEKKRLKELMHSLKLGGDVEKVAAMLLSWASCTMAKRYAEQMIENNQI